MIIQVILFVGFSTSREWPKGPRSGCVAGQFSKQFLVGWITGLESNRWIFFQPNKNNWLTRDEKSFTPHTHTLVHESMFCFNGHFKCHGKSWDWPKTWDKSVSLGFLLNWEVWAKHIFFLCGYNLQHVSSSHLQQVNPEKVCQNQRFHEPFEGQNSIEFVSSQVLYHSNIQSIPLRVLHPHLAKFPGKYDIFEEISCSKSRQVRTGVLLFATSHHDNLQHEVSQLLL